MKTQILKLTLCVLGLTTLGCGSATNLVKAKAATIVTLPSQTHHLYEVYAFQEGDNLVIYGKVKQTSGFCITPGHVDVAIVGKNGDVVSTFGIPSIKRGGKKRPGWFGAHYRARIKMMVPLFAQIRLAFHGDHCYPGMTFDVAENYAAPEAYTREHAPLNKP